MTKIKKVFDKFWFVWRREMLRKYGSRKGLIERVNTWNRFIDEVCYKDEDTLTEIQKMAFLCFWYDAEMGSGGHSGYFDCYPNTNPKELEAAIRFIANDEIADNYVEAIEYGEKDAYCATDAKYYCAVPELSDYLQEFVDKNKEIIFN